MHANSRFHQNRSQNPTPPPESSAAVFARARPRFSKNRRERRRSVRNSRALASLGVGGAPPPLVGPETPRISRPPHAQHLGRAGQARGRRRGPDRLEDNDEPLTRQLD